MQENKVKNLTTKEINSMLSATINYDIDSTKYFIELIINMRDNSSEETSILQEIKKLLDELKIKEAAQLIQKLWKGKRVRW